MKFSEYKNLSKEEQKKVSFKEIPTAIKITIVVVCLLIISLFSSKSCSGNSQNDLKVEAYIQAKNYVSSVLKSPSSAEFDLNYSIKLNTDSTVLISGNVDSQNSFGAMIRSTYILKMKWEDGESGMHNWKLIDIDIK